MAFLMLIQQAQFHEDEWERGGIALQLTSAIR
jgi:hypothetical protein